MTKLAYILFSARSEDTGKKLFAELSKRNLGGYSWRWTKGSPRERPDLVLRWGNGYQYISPDIPEVNSKAGNKTSVDKLKMAKALNEDKNVNFLDVVFDLKSDELQDLTDDNGKVYIRSSVGREQPVRYDVPSSVRYGDVYATRNCKKLKEYRSHVVGEDIICTFEKEPYEGRENTAIYKDHNCRFRRDDSITFGSSALSQEIKKQAILATKAVGLHTAGVDVFLLEDGSVVIGEVNSAPALNTPSIQRWVNGFEHLFNQLNLNNDERKEAGENLEGDLSNPVQKCYPLSELQTVNARCQE